MYGDIDIQHVCMIVQCLIIHYRDKHIWEIVGRITRSIFPQNLFVGPVMPPSTTAVVKASQMIFARINGSDGSDRRVTNLNTVTTFKYVEGGPDREAPEVV